MPTPKKVSPIGENSPKTKSLNLEVPMGMRSFENQVRSLEQEEEEQKKKEMKDKDEEEREEM